MVINMSNLYLMFPGTGVRNTCAVTGLMHTDLFGYFSQTNDWRISHPPLSFHARKHSMVGYIPVNQIEWMSSCFERIFFIRVSKPLLNVITNTYCEEGCDIESEGMRRPHEHWHRFLHYFADVRKLIRNTGADVNISPILRGLNSVVNFIREQEALSSV